MTLKGKGLIANVNGIALTAGIVSATHTAAFQSAQFDRTADSFYVLGSDGETIAAAYHNAKNVLRVTVVPYAATLADGRTATDAWLGLTPGLLLTVTDADGTVLDDNYNLVSTSHGRSNNGVATVDVVMESFVANEVATSPIS